MRSFGPLAAAMLLAACGRGGDGPVAAPANESRASPSRSGASAVPAPAGEAAVVPARWHLQTSGEGAALALLPASGPAAIRLFCPAGRNRMRVDVPAFRPIASEERLSFGSGGEAVALVADPLGDRQSGGVSGTGEIPASLERLVAGPLSASYGAQSSGPHPPPPEALARAFAAACNQGAAAVRQAEARAAASASPCRLQGGEALSMTPLRAVGTEPFWSARIEGRCVTYSNPEDQHGTRIWTRYTPGPGGGIWSGALGGRRFELRTRDHPGCSDGMSDKSYPIAVELIVAGERRTGCAEPA